MRVLNMRTAHAAELREAIDISRGSTLGLGNPFRIGIDGSREEVIRDFERYARQKLKTDPAFRERVKGLYGFNLKCFCAPAACHGDVYIKLCQELNDGR